MKIKLNKKKLYDYFFIWQRFLVNKLIDIYIMIINYKNKSQKKTNQLHSKKHLFIFSKSQLFYKNSLKQQIKQNHYQIGDQNIIKVEIVFPINFAIYNLIENTE